MMRWSWIGTGMYAKVLAALLSVVVVSAGQAYEPAFEPIFDGESLDGWAGDDAYWRVEDGSMIGESTEGNVPDRNTFLIWDEGEVDDFELRFEYRIESEHANSGVQVRSVDEGDYVVGGYQPDIATDDWITGIFYEERGRGVLARRGERVTIDADGERTAERFASEDELYEHIDQEGWNTYHVIARGDTIRTEINGELMHEVTDRSDEAREQGVLAFQLHAGEPMRVAFRDVQLKRLPLEGDRKKVVFMAGPESHGYGEHEHNGGSKLLAQWLAQARDDVVTTVYHDGWPSDPTAFDNADAVVMFSNGGGGHPVRPHLEDFAPVMERGVGLVALHYAVEIPPDEGDYFLDWLGGYFETHWSVNPFWDLEEAEVHATHPIGRGVEPYQIHDEWYYHMRFREGKEGVSPILTGMPPEHTLERDDGPHSGNPHVREAVLEREEPQHVAWAVERDDGGRGFGFTGAHYHWNWAHPMQRRAVMNAILWTAGAEVPESGVALEPVSMEELEAVTDSSQPGGFDRERWADLVEQWQADLN